MRTSHYPPARPSWTPATSWVCWCSWEMPGGQHIGDEAWKAQALQNCREMVCQCRNHPSMFLQGVHASTAAPTMSLLQAYQRGHPSAGPHPPHGGCPYPPPQAAAGGCVRLQRLFLPAAARAVRTAPPSPRTSARATSSASSAGQNFPAKPFDDEAHRLVQALHLPLCSTIPLPSRAWRAALAGAWPTTTPTGNSAAATASATTA